MRLADRTVGWMRLGTSRGLRSDLAAFGLGAVAALALPPLHVIPALVLAMAGLLWQMRAADTAIEAGRRGWWFGFGLNVVGLYWITEAILFEAARYWWLVPLAVPALAAVMAVFIALPVWMARHLSDGWPRVLVLAGAWTAFDLARQFVLTGFPWNPLGSIWAIPGAIGDAMIQPAAWISVHGLTLMTLLLACLPTLGRKAAIAAAAALLLWAGAGIARLSRPVPPDESITVVLVQGNIPQGQKWSQERAIGIFQHYLDLTAGAVKAAESQQVVTVWPETASPFPLETDDAAREAVMAATQDQPALIGSVRFGADRRPRNALFALVAGGATAAIYEKWHLVPFGEYQPDWLPLGIQLVPGGGFAAGPGPRTIYVPGLPPLGVLICYETIFPGQIVEGGNRPAWLVNVTNDAWFGNSSGPRQHLTSSRLRSVEEGLPIIRVANTGITAAYDARGRELGRVHLNTTGTLSVPLPAALPAPLFARLGLALPLSLTIAACCLGSVLGRIRARA
jgi:apolipoprotein N-acyltransferase